MISISELKQTNALRAAYMYKDFLPTKGFSSVATSLSGYTPKVGDVAVFNKIGGRPWGHIQMFNGSNWVSDFKQNTFFPWRSSDYTIFRWNN